MEKKPDFERVEINGITFLKWNNRKALKKWMTFIKKLAKEGLPNLPKIISPSNNA